MVIFMKQKQFLNPCDEIFHMRGDLGPLANTLSHLSEFSIFESKSTKIARGESMKMVQKMATLG